VEEARNVSPCFLKDRYQGMMSLSLPLALPAGQEKKLWDAVAPTIQDRLQCNVSLEAFLWLVQK
jgi:hypothetical protein